MIVGSFAHPLLAPSDAAQKWANGHFDKPRALVKCDGAFARDFDSGSTTFSGSFTLADDPITYSITWRRGIWTIEREP